LERHIADNATTWISRELEIFLLLAETLHFGRAAEHGNLSPSR